MKPTLLIAADSIRALLHRRLLLALMLASVGLTAALSIGSFGFGKVRKEIVKEFEQKPDAPSMPGMEKMSEADRRKMRESLEGAGDVYQAFYYGAASFGGSLVALFVFCTAVSAEI